MCVDAHQMLNDGLRQFTFQKEGQHGGRNQDIGLLDPVEAIGTVACAPAPLSCTSSEVVLKISLFIDGIVLQ